MILMLFWEIVICFYVTIQFYRHFDCNAVSHLITIWCIGPFLFTYSIQRLNNLVLSVRDVRTSTTDIATKMIFFWKKTTTKIPPLKMGPYSASSITRNVKVNSKAKEQNWPKNVTAFLLFLFLMTDGSRICRRRALLSWLNMKWKKQM